MSYKALYRTYRPQIFGDVTGQEVVVKTLQNAIKNNKISHAYLFSGPRGTGKTSIARIFAKALNCTNLQDNEPCDNCVSCKEISQGYNPDVIEIDAASNNGVDEIRDIREKVKFLPSGSKYKVYIIDEVHMLSGGAFNALLKTLEEPPKHAVFILATTEPQKLPATIISRCQRFEFKALSINEINERLREICANEGVNITEEALNCIGESAEGAMRDALSILDQAISYGNKSITIDDINGVTGSLSFEKMITLTEAIEERNVHSAISQLNELISSGKEVSKIVNSLLVFYRDVLLYKSVGDTGFSKYIFGKEEFQEFSTNIQTSKLMYFIDILCDVQSKVKFSTTPNIFLEISLIKMCNITIEELDIVKRLNDLEEKYNNLGSFDLPAEGVEFVDNEKVNTLELRVNQIINELNRLEIRKQLEKINHIEGIVNNINTNNANSDSSRIVMQEIQVLKDKINEIDLFVNKEDKESNSDLLEKIENIEIKINELSVPEIHQPVNVDLTEVYEKIETLEKSKGLDEIQESLEQLKEIVDSIVEDINSIKENIIENENKEYDISENEVDIKEIKEKVMFLERRLYQIVAGELSTKKVVKKDNKKNNGQIMLFGEELLSINDFEQTKENYDFEELQKPKEEIKEVVEEPSERNEEPIIVEKEVEVVEAPIIEKVEEEKVNIINNEEKVEDQEISLFEEVDVQTILDNKKEDEKEVSQSNQKGLFESEYFVSDIKETVEEPKISKYFDITNEQEVIHKEKSVLFVGEKRVVEEKTSIEKDIIALESDPQPVVVENKPLAQESIENKPDEESKKDKFAKYDIKDIEKLLHDSRAMESKNDKVRIEQVWRNMTRGARPEHLSIIETLQEGKVAVVGNKEFIIVFPNVSICNIVMRRKFKDVAIRILYNLLGDTYDYVALPIDVWTRKSREYKEQYQIGIRFPTLKPLNVPGLEIASDVEEYQSKTDRTIDKTIELFGKDNVEIE